MTPELYPHQQDAVEKMHNGCVLAGDVGTGKTITALFYALLKESGRDIYVITTAKKRDSGDWQHEAAKLAIHPDKIVVDSWNNIGHYHKIYGAIFIFDEQRLVGTGAWVKTFLDIARKNHWILLSATPGDTWLDYVPVFIANGFYKNITEFRQEHVIYARFAKYPKVDRYVNTGRLLKYRAQILVEMPVERHTTRHIKMVECDYDKERFDRVWKKRWNVYEDRPLLDAGELFRVGRKVVGSDPSRLQAVRELIATHQKVVVFYNFDYELEMLRSLASSMTTTSTLSNKEVDDPLAGTIWEKGFDEEKAFLALDQAEHSRSTHGSRPKWSTGSITSMHTPSSDQPFMDSEKTDRQISKSFEALTVDHGSSAQSQTSSLPRSKDSFAVAEWNGHKHEKIPATDSWVYLVQYTAGSEGWNCTTSDAMIFFSLTYSYKQFYQAQGRIDRLNTPFTDLFYYVLTSKSIVDRAVWRALQAKKDFNVRGFRL